MAEASCTHRREADVGQISRLACIVPRHAPLDEVRDEKDADVDLGLELEEDRVFLAYGAAALPGVEEAHDDLFAEAQLSDGFADGPCDGRVA